MIDEDLIKAWTPPAIGQTDSLELREKIARAVVLWLFVAAEQGRGFPDSPNILRIDMDHSCLLQRLLSGTPPLPKPPPKHFSSPWYELIDDGFASPLEVWEIKAKKDRGLIEHFGDALFIDKEPWSIVERRGPNDWLVKHSRDENVWRVWSTGKREGMEDEAEHKSMVHLWRIERFTPEASGETATT